MMNRMARRLAGAAPLTLCLVAGATMAAPAAAAEQTIPAKDGQPSTAAANPTANDYPVDGMGDGVTSGGYNQSRWAEDWTKLRDPKKRDDPIDRLKFIPIAGDGDTYLTLSGEFRLRVNHVTNPDLRDRRAQRQDINRIVGAADLHIGDHLRFFGELAHGGLSGVELGTRLPQLKNALVVQQSFVDLTGDVGGAHLGVRYGRQTFADGPNLMVVPRDNNTIFTVFNGARVWARGTKVRADAFDFYTTRLGVNGTSDDLIDRGRRFSGVSAGIVVPRDWFGGSKLFFDPFVWRLRNDAAVWGTRTLREKRMFYGLHLYGDAGPVNVDYTIQHQGGEFGNQDISAWLIFAAQSYRLGKGRTAPRIGFHADYASGGGSYDGGTLRTSLAPFGNNIYYSYQLYATPANLIALAPNVTFNPIPKLRTTLEYQASWRATDTDAVYRANGSAFAGTQNVRGVRKIADTLRAQVVWSFTPRVSFTGRYEHLIAGPSLTRAGFRSSDFLAGWLSFRF